jgi:NSS family neurotransmitter:Na+ symporter
LQTESVGVGWSSRLVFLMAAVGASVGLGNIWKFPYVAGANGGGAFVTIYLLAAVLIAVPILIAELMIGRRGRFSPPTAMSNLATATGSSQGWVMVGWFGVIAGFLILSYYSVIGGWMLAYIPKAAMGEFTGLLPAEAEAAFAALLADPVTLIIWHTAFIAATTLIIARGIEGGIEAAVKILMPLLFLMLLGMIVYATLKGDMGAAINFLFSSDFSLITPQVLLVAVGQAFFSVGVGIGIMMTYGAYLSNDISLPRSAILIVLADTGVAILAGLAIFPLVFGNNLDPTDGPGLLLVTLPIAFGQMEGGAMMGTVFFSLVVFAAVTSAIAILEPIVSFCIDRLKMSRVQAAVSCGSLAWLIGLVSVFSFNTLSDFYPLASVGAWETKTMFDLIDHFTANFMLPIGGAGVSLFVGWRLPFEAIREELPGTPIILLKSWIFLLRFVVPICLLLLVAVGIV